LPNGIVGAAYSQTLASTGGAGGNTWSISAGALPAGLTLAANGTISGTPSGVEAASFWVVITNVEAVVVITTQSLAPAAQGVAYSQTLTAAGGAGGYRWSLSAGALPAGLTLDASGLISGTPAGNTSSFTVLVM